MPPRLNDCRHPFAAPIATKRVKTTQLNDVHWRQRLPLRSADRRQRLPSPGQGDDRVAPLRLGQGDDRVTSARALQQIMYL